MTKKGNVSFSVFTKPWKLSIPELGDLVSSMGFDGIELPVRPGYPVDPTNAARELPNAVRKLAEYGVKVFSIAGPSDEPTVRACAEAGVPVIRIMAPIGGDGFLAAESRLQRELEALVPVLDRHGVKIGVQNHNGRYVANASGLRHLMAVFDPKHVGAVWDAAHTALNGEEPELAIELIWSHLCMVNLKNAFWQRTNGPEAETAEWRVHWTSGRHGLASWSRVVAELKRRGYRGVVCLTAEYTDEAATQRLIAEDLTFARALFER